MFSSFYQSVSLTSNSDWFTHLKLTYHRMSLTSIQWKNITNTFSNGCLGSHNDEERSEMRYVMRIAESSESSKFWTQLALPRKYVCWSVCSSQPEVKTLWSRPFGVSTLNALRCNPSDTYRTSTIITSLRGMRMKSTWRNFYPRWSASIAVCVVAKDGNPFGPPISQDYPLNLSI